MRHLCSTAAKVLETQVRAEQKRGWKLSVKVMQAKLSERFMEVLREIEHKTKQKEQEAAKEADKFMEDFMVFEE